MKPIWTKRVYSARLFFQDILFMTLRIFALIDTVRSRRIARPFAEKIMLATTAVNECAYCARLHSQLALHNGVAAEEITQLLAADLDRAVDDYEYRALCFAQHYAETDRHPGAEDVQALVDFYGQNKANDIMMYIRLIYIGNLIGNTFDALRSRLRGKPHPDSHLAFELLLFGLIVPLISVLALPALALVTLVHLLVPASRALAPSALPVHS